MSTVRPSFEAPNLVCVSHSDVEPLQGSISGDIATQGRLPSVANPGLFAVTPSGYRADARYAFWLLADRFPLGLHPGVRAGESTLPRRNWIGIVDTLTLPLHSRTGPPTDV